MSYVFFKLYLKYLEEKEKTNILQSLLAPFFFTFHFSLFQEREKKFS